MSAKWIWYRGEFEVYHNLAVHTRREQYGTICPAVWDVPTVYPIVEFNKTLTAECDGEFTCYAHGEGQVRIDREMYPLNAPIAVTAGEHTVKVRVQNRVGLPCIYIDSPLLVTDESWSATLHERGEAVSVGCEPAFTRPDDDPTDFPFVVDVIHPAREEAVEGGILYDFGREVFASLMLEGMRKDATYTVYYGESRGEALAGKGFRRCTVWEALSGTSRAGLDARGFRYVYIAGPARVGIHAITEMLDVKHRGAFSCDRPLVARIFDVCAYTFHLCAREFYYDGIKRDRWVWGGDVRESLMIGDYLFADRGLGRRSLLALLPKDRVISHVNNINDYSSLTLISVWEYYMSFGDAEFVRTYWTRIRLLYDFVLSRLDEEGLMVSRKGDWIFIDWSIMDKSGPLAAEQILLWYAHRCMARLAPLAGEDAAPYEARAEALRAVILKRFWREEKGCFIDCDTSGKEHVTRHGNIFAVLFDLVDGEKTRSIYQNVLKNGAVRAITTPYFKLYELAALCHMGHLDEAQRFLEDYWGGMLALGATTAWEQYDPAQRGEEHYAMYGEPYGKSLCHAWSCGPIYLLGRYCLGVSADAPAYERYTVAPKGGAYKHFEGVVPTVRGDIRVKVDGDRVEVLSAFSGGTLVWKGNRYPIPAGKTLVIEG